MREKQCGIGGSFVLIACAGLMFFRSPLTCVILKAHLGSHSNDSNFGATYGHVRLPPVALHEWVGAWMLVFDV
jgi:hypothetical protein